jgi:2-oxoglutarate dehydrogenase E2 component (dihydrolipoamide succinyltransferase)
LSNHSSKVRRLTRPYLIFCLGPGQVVNADEIVARIETDKVTVDITSPVAGTITKYFAAEGDTVAVGANFFEIDLDGKGGAAATAAPPKPAAPAEKKAEAPK